MENDKAPMAEQLRAKGMSVFLSVSKAAKFPLFLIAINESSGISS